MRIKKAVCCITFYIAVLLLILTGIQYIKRWQLQQEIAAKVLRFHVLANSDREADQQLKLKVRDAIGDLLREELCRADDREACEEIIAANLDKITSTAADVIASEGYDYPVEAFVKTVDFPVKTYGSYTFPAGRYEALEVMIGEGSGHNWWCVMYPNMCFAGSMYEVVEEEAGESLKEVLSEEEYEAVAASGDYRIRFKYLSFLNQLIE